MNTLELLDRLIAFDTTSAKSNLALIEFVADYLADHGVEARTVPNREGTKASLFATIGTTDGDTAGGVALSGHSDVVPVEGQAWDSDPFALVERDGRLYGRGTCDMKGFIAAALAAVPAMVARDLRQPLHLAFSYDEEVGCMGVRPMLELLGRELPKPEIALIGEPTMMRPANSHKGQNSFYTTVTGLEAHSSQQHRGVNAILFANRVIAKLAEIAYDVQARAPADCPFDPPFTSFSVGTIEGGTASNIIPLRCSFVWEYRSLPGSDTAEIPTRLQAFIDDELLPEARAIHPGATIETVPRSAVPPCVPEPNSLAETLVKKLLGTNEVGVVAYATEAGLFQQVGLSAVVCGPGDIAQAHQPNEFVARDQLDACDAMLAGLIDWAAA